MSPVLYNLLEYCDINEETYVVDSAVKRGFDAVKTHIIEYECMYEQHDTIKENHLSHWRSVSTISLLRSSVVLLTTTALFAGHSLLTCQQAALSLRTACIRCFLIRLPACLLACCALRNISTPRCNRTRSSPSLITATQR